jgi:hypothetical protein
MRGRFANGMDAVVTSLLRKKLFRSFFLHLFSGARSVRRAALTPYYLILTKRNY